MFVTLKGSEPGRYVTVNLKYNRVSWLYMTSKFVRYTFVDLVPV